MEVPAPPADEHLYCQAKIAYAGLEEPVIVETPIYDGRRAALPGWETTGFERIEAPSAMSDWADEAALANLHSKEIETLARTLSGCDAVLFYPPLLRTPERARQQPDLAPIELVHSDYTEAYGPMIADPTHPYHAILAPTMAPAGVLPTELGAMKRVLTLQFWRNIGDRAMDYPLAFCDARTVPRDALAPIRVSEYGGLTTEFDAFAVAAPADPAAFHWYLFPELGADEVVVFRAYDSDRVASGEPFWTPHVSFRDPRQPPDAPGRRSIEMRAICLFR